MVQVLALRHVPFEDLGLLGPVLAERGHTVSYCDTPTDDLAALNAIAPGLMVVLGGPIGAYDTASYPFLADEIRLIGRRLRAGLPMLGICLGAQLMAAALGARVAPMAAKEIGWSPLTLTPEGAAGCLAPLDGAKTAVLHWHGDTFDIPDGAVRLAASAACANQAFRWGNAALALQFHVEAAGAALERWFVGHAGEIAATPGVTVARLRADTARWSAAIAHQGRTFFTRWLAEAGL